MKGKLFATVVLMYAVSAASAAPLSELIVTVVMDLSAMQDGDNSNITVYNNYGLSASNCSEISYKVYGSIPSLGSYKDITWIMAVPECSDVCANGAEFRDGEITITLDDSRWVGVYDYNNAFGNATVGVPLFNQVVSVPVLYCLTCKSSKSDCNTAFQSYRTGYERKSYTWSCENGCVSSVAYRCAAGYWGSSTNGTSGCTRCDSIGGVYGVTSPHSDGSAVARSECCINENTNISDDRGEFAASSKCCWSDK